jgi:hypothetical protein
VAEATGEAEPPPLRMHPVHRANLSPKRNSRQGRLFG